MSFAPPTLSRMVFAAGQAVRVKSDGTAGRIFLKLPLRDVYLVQFPGFPVVEKVYNGCELEPLTAVASEPPLWPRP